MMDGWRSIEFSGAACDWFPATDVVVVLCGDMSLSPCQDVPSLNVFFHGHLATVRRDGVERGPELCGTNRLELPPKRGPTVDLGRTLFRGTFLFLSITSITCSLSPGFLALAS